MFSFDSPSQYLNIRKHMKYEQEEVQTSCEMYLGKLQERKKNQKDIKVCLEALNRKRQFGRLKCKWDDNIKMNLREITRERLD